MELLTRKEAAERLNVSPRWLADNWREGPKFYRLNGKTVRYREEDLDAWLDHRFVDVGQGAEGRAIRAIRNARPRRIRH